MPQNPTLLTFDPYTIDLPVTEIFDEVKQHLNTNNTIIVNAPAGAGKSTLLPLALINSPWLKGKKILMLEPRRLAARTIATRMASLSGDKVGETIGYRIRFDNRTSANTQIEVLTEGILTRMLQSDNALEGVGLVIFDEFHERSLFADVALALCREAQQILRPDLRIMIMSATLNMPHLTQLLKAPAVISEGRQYPVDIQYMGGRDLMMLPEVTANTVKNAVKKHEGDVLVFLPGEGEIKKCEILLKSLLKDFSIHPLYGQLPQAKQMAAIMPHKQGKRKVVLATSIAETSLTIEGVHIVVDSGLGRTQKFDPRSGLSRLETIEISKDSADQRAGRAGRLAPGVCYRMWTKADHERMQSNRIPEIEEADLASLVLEMAMWGVEDIRQLTWLTPPPSGALSQASHVLHQLDALEDDKITPHGKKIHQLSCHPRLAHMLLMAKEEGVLAHATDVAALLEERDPLQRQAGIDLNLRIEALRKQRRENHLGKKFRHIEKIASQYRQIFNIEAENGNVDPFETGVLVAYAYPERIACARPGNNAQFQLANGNLAMAGHKDSLAHEPWLAVAHLNAREGVGKIFLAAALNPRDLASLVKERQMITWDSRKGGVVATKDLRIGSIVLQSKPISNPDPDLIIKAICDTLSKEGENLLDFNEETTQFQNRILSLQKWNPEQTWPDISTKMLVKTTHHWLAPYLTHVKKPDDLQKINLLEVLTSTLPFEKQQQLDLLAPQKITVPSGSKITIKYHANGDTPILAVRLQEMFGLDKTPSVNGGKTALVLHLLSPGFKPVQITSDLASFWNNTYYEVKKELRIKYAKHVWPDDPWKEQPVRGVKRKKK